MPEEASTPARRRCPRARSIDRQILESTIAPLSAIATLPFAAKVPAHPKRLAHLGWGDAAMLHNSHIQDDGIHYAVGTALPGDVRSVQLTHNSVDTASYRG